MNPRGRFWWFRSPNAVALLASAFLLQSCMMFSNVGVTRCYRSRHVPVVQTQQGLTLDPEAADASAVGYLYSPRPRRTGPWAVTTRWLSPEVRYLPSDGSTPTPEQIEELREPYARLMEGEYANPELAAVIRANAGPVGVPVISGYLENAAVLAVPVMFLGASLLCLADRARAQRRVCAAEAGLCPACEYDLRGNTIGRCPECGAAPA